MKEEFISELIEPVEGTMGPVAMAKGEPALPGRFVWRGEEYVVAEVLETWKETGPDKGGGEAKYLRKHWFKIRTDSGVEMKIYFQRQPQSRAQSKKRWWLYSVSAND